MIESKACAFIKFGNAEPIFIKFDNVKHDPVFKLKFILAGKQFAYPGFNGQIASVVICA